MRAFHDWQDSGSGICVRRDGGGTGYRADGDRTGGCKYNGGDYYNCGGYTGKGICVRCDFDPAEQDTDAGNDDGAAVGSLRRSGLQGTAITVRTCRWRCY